MANFDPESIVSRKLSIITQRILPLLVTSQATSKSSRSSTGSSSSSQAGSSPLRDVMDKERDSGILKRLEVQQKPLGLRECSSLRRNPSNKPAGGGPGLSGDRQDKRDDGGKELPPRLLRLASSEQERTFTHRDIRVKGQVDSCVMNWLWLWNVDEWKQICPLWQREAQPVTDVGVTVSHHERKAGYCDIAWFTFGLFFFF